MHRRMRRSAILVGLLTLLAVFSSCRRSDGPAESQGRAVTDLAGRSVAVPDKVQRLVALGPGAMRLVAYLGAADRVVGIEEFERRMSRDVYERPYASTLSEAFRELPVVGAGGPGVLPDFEQLLMCRPDLIVAVSMEPSQLDNIQAKTGVPAVYLSYGALGVWRDEARRSLALLGELLGEGQRAAAINAYLAAAEEDLKERTETLEASERPAAYFGGISYKGAHGLTSTEAGYPPARLARVRNLADSLETTGHFFIDKEQILLWNPDFIFIDTGSRSILDDDFQKNGEFYRLLKAAESGQVFSVLPYNYYNTNIELALLNAYFIGKCVYPEQFSDVDIEEKAREIMAVFLGVRPEQEIPAYRTLRFPATGPVEW